MYLHTHRIINENVRYFEIVGIVEFKYFWYKEKLLSSLNYYFCKLIKMMNVLIFYCYKCGNWPYSADNIKVFLQRVIEDCFGVFY